MANKKSSGIVVFTSTLLFGNGYLFLPVFVVKNNADQKPLKCKVASFNLGCFITLHLASEVLYSLFCTHPFE